MFLFVHIKKHKTRRSVSLRLTDIAGGVSQTVHGAKSGRFLEFLLFFVPNNVIFLFTSFHISKNQKFNNSTSFIESRFSRCDNER